MHTNDTFNPPRYLRNPMLQTVLASAKLRTIGPNRMLARAEERIIDAGDGVRLMGFASRQAGASRGLVIMLHGWEGSVNSAYMKKTGGFLYGRGFDIFRLNFRDHGGTHHLNRGVFLGTLIDEAYRAVVSVAAMFPGTPVFVVGFSMGGNFAVRIARRYSKKDMPLRHVVAINPSLDPLAATVRIDEIPFIKKYFLKKWKRSLKVKQELYPEDYDFGDILSMDNCMEMTRVLLKRYSPYRDEIEYFGGYTLTRGYLDSMKIPLTIIMSEDDPVVPAGDFFSTKMNKNVTLMMQKYGGHCGYIEGITMNSWYQKKLEEIFSETGRPG